jgi:ElaB/YqjD/DUF883 family membrane-anchored ribosome-binding protein
MAETTEVIQNDIEETRSDLADKLAVLGEKITGTVTTVEETVANVTEKASETVEAVKETVSDTVEAVKDSVSNTVETVRNAFDLQKQAQERPWLVFGGAVALGFVGGKLLGGFTARHSHQEAYWGSHPRGHNEGPAAYRSASESAQPQPTASQETPSQEAKGGPSWFGSITEKFGSELSTLKGLALGSLFGVVRDMIVQHLPKTLKDDVGNVINQVTESVGGKTIQGPVLGESQDESSDQDQEGEQSHQQSGQEKRQGRPQGIGEYSGK